MRHISSDIYNDSVLFVCVCRRQRELKPGQSPYRALLDTLELSDSRLTLQLINDNNKVRHASLLLLFSVESSVVFGSFSVFCRFACCWSCTDCRGTWHVWRSMNWNPLSLATRFQMCWSPIRLLNRESPSSSWHTQAFLWHNWYYFSACVCLQTVSGGAGWERSGLVSGWGWATAHCKRSTVPIGHHWGSSGARVRQLPRPAGLRTHPSTQGHVSPNPHTVSIPAADSRSVL